MKNLLTFIVCLIFIQKVILKMENINYDYTFLASTSFIRKAGVLCSFLIDTNFFNYDNKLDPVDMEKQLFDLELILDYETSLKMRCHFWSKKIPNLKIICRLIDKPKYYQYYYGAKIKDSYFSYKDKILGVSSSSLHLDIISTKYPFIYADEQDLDLNDGEDVYILKFRVGVYYDKNLFLRDTNMEDNFLIPLDNCLVINDEISCSITKEKIKTFAHRYSTLPRAYLGVESFDLEYRHERYVYASDIHIKFEDNIRRENVNVEIIKVIDKILGNGYFIVFETNVKNFPIFKSEPFNLNFTHSDTGRSEAHKCYFRKHEDTPLLILCESFTNSYSKGIYYTLDKIDKLNISNINVYHNFIISYSNIEIITPAMTYSRQYRYIYAVYPDILDFTSRDSLNITFISSIGSIKE